MNSFTSPGLYDLQTPDEERINWLTHGVGFLFSLFGLGVLISAGSGRGAGGLVACAVYGVSLAVLFGVSTFYHACTRPAWKQVARALDHSAILLLIAGTYTPFMSLALGGWKGWTVLSVVWLLAVVGILHKFTSPNPYGARSVVLCLIMGWLVVLVWQPLALCLTPAALTWLVLGGVTYTLGVPFYAWHAMPYSHAVWHLFVLAGAACHFHAVLEIF